MLLVLALEMLVAGAIGLATVQLARSEILKANEHTAETLLEDTLAVARTEGPEGLREFLTLRGAETDDVFLLTDGSGRSLVGSLESWPKAAKPDGVYRPLFLKATNGKASVEFGTYATRLSGGQQLLVGHSLTRSNQAMDALLDAFLLAALLGLPLALVAAWLVVQLVDARLRNFEDVLGNFGVGEMDDRIADHGTDDSFDRLAKIENVMMDRMSGLIAELRLVTDSLAHDLRSPLTRIQAQLATVAESEDVEDHKTANEAVANDLEHLLFVLNQMLQIGRAEGGVGREAFVPVDLQEILADLAEIYGPVAEDAERDITLDAAIAAPLQGQPDLLARAFANLIENALHHGAGNIRLRLTETATGYAIQFADEGAGIAPEDEAAALRRFGRLDPARRTPGSGLGLALVNAIAHLHDGQLQFERDENSFAVVMTLPKPAPRTKA
ncbi:sensor histidine kinase [Aurantiacibacter rhizosphaerae]|uniref:histidine kinase n=1 Tax=Aurantiacibacter rhizosphaerae TaxID=2691582 RepID=A0A844XFJ3_9SPHN|nr:HAMP domain-containing sensor histidine kinase [Aurantiacibacter rhizosphaerae]MWV29247.1 two-component sensor histidine kinase [Aurantiacibacter rhizosphaerae]